MEQKKVKIGAISPSGGGFCPSIPSSGYISRWKSRAILLLYIVWSTRVLRSSISWGCRWRQYIRERKIHRPLPVSRLSCADHEGGRQVSLAFCSDWVRSPVSLLPGSDRIRGTRAKMCREWVHPSVSHDQDGVRLVGCKRCNFFSLLFYI